MAGETRFIKCAFKEGDLRHYTYVWDGEEGFEIGDRVEVETAKGTRVVVVAGFATEKPPFECKPILRKAPPKEEKPAEDAAASAPRDIDDEIPW